MKYSLKKVLCISLVVFVLLMTGAFAVTKFSSKEKDINDLINISELSEEFMDNYFEEYNKLEEEEKENMLIVISSEEIKKEDVGASEIIEGPNNKYYLTFEDDIAKEEAVKQLNENEATYSIEENIIREFYVDENVQTEQNNKIYNSWGIKAMGMDNVKTMLSNVAPKEVVVAILDTGLDVDLFNKYYPGRIKETHNVLPEEEVTSMYDNNGHGTHIAGTIAEGTPKNVKIIPVKISDSARIFETDILAGLEYVAYYTEVDVINMSFGGYSYSEAEYITIEAARQKNIIAVAAAGNENTYEPSYPASFDNTISIASIDENLSKSDFSNYGSNITFAAPGGEINSLMASYMALSGNMDGDDDHETISGTSMATPHAVSAVAMLKSFNKNLSLENIIEILKNNVTDLGSYGYDYYYGYGFINFTDAIMCDDSVNSCDEFNIFKTYEPQTMTISELKFTNYNYGTITNLLLSTVDFVESDGYNYQKQLWQLEDVVIDGYDPYSTEGQTITIKYLDFETTIDIQNPENYELGWEYSTNDGFAYLSGYKDNGSEINKLYIPTEINDITIKGIENFTDENSNLFYNSSDANNFNEVIIPKEIEYIGDYAFAGLKNVGKIVIKNPEMNIGIGSFSNMPFLTTIDGQINLSENSSNVFKDDLLLEQVNISNTTTIIPVSTFENCGLLKSITIPNSVTRIGDFAFRKSGLSDINFSNQLKEIGIEAFKEAKISNLTLPDSLEVISDYAFSHNLIGTIEIPKNVNSIGIAPFSGNYIETIVVNPENNYYDSRDNSNLIIETSTNKIVQGSIKSVIPSSVRIIGEAAYSWLNNPPGSGLLIELSRLFTTLEIPEGVTTIEKDAFFTSAYLSKVVIPESVTYIDPTIFLEGTSGMATICGKTSLWVHENSYAYDYAINNDSTYVIIENSSVAELIDGFVFNFEPRIYYPNEIVDVEGIEYYYWDYSAGSPKYVDIPNYTIIYQNGDSFRYGDDKFYFSFSIENAYQNVKAPYNVLVEKFSQIEIPTINLLIGQKILDITTTGLNLEHGILYFNDSYVSFDQAGDYTIKGYFISDDDNYSDMWDLDIPVHVINKKYIKNKVSINTKIYDGTTYIDPKTIILEGVEKSNYTIVSANLNSTDYIGNDAEATIKIRLNDEFYKNNAFTGDNQELEWTTKIAVADLDIPEVNLLIGEEYFRVCDDFGCFSAYNSISFDEPGNYTINVRYMYNNSFEGFEDILLPVHVINKQYVPMFSEVFSKKYDGTLEIDLDAIIIQNVNKDQYTITSSKLEYLEVMKQWFVNLKVKLTDSAYKNYAFTGDKQEAEWLSPVKVIKGIPKYDIPNNLKAKKGQKLSEISLPQGFEWMNGDEVLNEIGKKNYKAKYTPEDTKYYEIVENIDISINVMDDSTINNIVYSSSDYSGIYDEKEHSISIDVELDNYSIKYSVDNLDYNLSELPQFKDVGEYTINYKITSDGYTDVIGSNKVKIYGIKGFDKTIKVKNNILILNDGSFNNLKNKVNIYSESSTFNHLDIKKNSISSDIIKTGEYLNIKINDSKIYEYELSFIGDINGDGSINSADLLRIRQYLLGTVSLSNSYYKAADINYDDSVNSADLLRIRQHLIGTKPISE